MVTKGIKIELDQEAYGMTHNEYVDYQIMAGTKAGIPTDMIVDARAKITDFKNAVMVDLLNKGKIERNEKYFINPLFGEPGKLFLYS